MKTLPVKSKDGAKGSGIEEEVIKCDKTQKKIWSGNAGIPQYPDKNPVSC